MTISIVQQTALANTASNVNSFATNAFSSNPTVGNSIILMLLYQLTSAHTISIADTGSNTYVPDQACNLSGGTTPTLFDPTSTNPSLSTPVIAFLHAPVNTSGASFKVTTTVGGGGVGKFAAVALEISGMASPPFDADGYGGASSNSNTIPTCGTSSLTTTVANELILAGFCSATLTGTPTCTAPGSYNLTNLSVTSPSTTAAGAVAYQIVSSIQTAVNPTFTVSRYGAYASLAVGYKATNPLQYRWQLCPPGLKPTCANEVWQLGPLPNPPGGP